MHRCCCCSCFYCCSYRSLNVSVALGGWRVCGTFATRVWQSCKQAMCTTYPTRKQTFYAPQEEERHNSNNTLRNINNTERIYWCWCHLPVPYLIHKVFKYTNILIEISIYTTHTHTLQTYICLCVMTALLPGHFIKINQETTVYQVDMLKFKKM